MWRDLGEIGRSATTGGYFRQPFTAAEGEMRAWFHHEAGRRGFRVETDRFGNLAATWRVPMLQFTTDQADRAILTGSHLDSVLDGGAYDGPLGVATAFAAIDLLRARGVAPSRPVIVAAFVEEEGSRFGRACLGSRLAVGATSWEEARGLKDRAGISFEDALDQAGAAGTDVLDFRERASMFVELHIEQGRDLADREFPIAVASEIWPHGRYRFTFTGEANHAGTTRMVDRADPMLTYAMTALAANKQARLLDDAQGPRRARATFGRVECEPNSTNAVPSRVTAWMDARASSSATLTELVAQITRQATERAERDGTQVEVVAESVSEAVSFDPGLASWLAADHFEGEWPAIPTGAGHDAGIVSATGLPTAMVFVRNPTGVSHSPAEHATMADCLLGVDALADTLARLAG